MNDDDDDGDDDDSDDDGDDDDNNDNSSDNSKSVFVNDDFTDGNFIFFFSYMYLGVHIV
jgi:hypothetical protein